MAARKRGKVEWLALESRLREILGQMADGAPREALARINFAIAAHTGRGNTLRALDGIDREHFDALEADEWARVEREGL